MIRLIRNRIDGIAEPLPAGETVLWSASPAPLPFAWRVLRIKWVAMWFLGLALWRATEAVQAGAGWEAASMQALGQLPLACGAIALLCGLGYWMARSTTYAVTQRRVVLQVGIALPITVNLPLNFIDGAAAQPSSGATGDLVLTMAAAAKIHTAALWPHVRTGESGRAQPVMRNVPALALQILAPVLAKVLEESQKQESFVPSPESSQRSMMNAPSAGFAQGAAA